MAREPILVAFRMAARPELLVPCRFCMRRRKKTQPFAIAAPDVVRVGIVDVIGTVGNRDREVFSRLVCSVEADFQPIVGVAAIVNKSRLFPIHGY